MLLVPAGFGRNFRKADTHWKQTSLVGQEVLGKYQGPSADHLGRG